MAFRPGLHSHRTVAAIKPLDDLFNNAIDRGRDVPVSGPCATTVDGEVAIRNGVGVTQALNSPMALQRDDSGLVRGDAVEVAHLLTEPEQSV
jgi:hypothetical protein